MTATLGILVDPSNSARTARCCSLQRDRKMALQMQSPQAASKWKLRVPDSFRGITGYAKRDGHGACAV